MNIENEEVRFATVPRLGKQARSLVLRLLDASFNDSVRLLDDATLCETCLAMQRDHLVAAIGNSFVCYTLLIAPAGIFRFSLPIVGEINKYFCVVRIFKNCYSYSPRNVIQRPWGVL